MGIITLSAPEDCGRLNQLASVNSSGGTWHPVSTGSVLAGVITTTSTQSPRFGFWKLFYLLLLYPPPNPFPHPVLPLPVKDSPHLQPSHPAYTSSSLHVGSLQPPQTGPLPSVSPSKYTCYSEPDRVPQTLCLLGPTPLTTIQLFRPHCLPGRGQSSLDFQAPSQASPNLLFKPHASFHSQPLLPWFLPLEMTFLVPTWAQTASRFQGPAQLLQGHQEPPSHANPLWLWGPGVRSRAGSWGLGPDALIHVPASIRTQRKRSEGAGQPFCISLS